MDENPDESPRAGIEKHWVERLPPTALGWLMLFNAAMLSLGVWMQWRAGNPGIAIFLCIVAPFSAAVGIFRVLRPTGVKDP